jgi:hypothetical protein
MIPGEKGQSPGPTVRLRVQADEVRRLYLMARAVRLGWGFPRGAEGKARAGGGVLRVDGGISQKLRHVGSHKENVGVAALDDLVTLATLIEGEFETAISIHQPHDLAATLLVSFLDLF